MSMTGIFDSAGAAAASARAAGKGGLLGVIKLGNGMFVAEYADGDFPRDEESNPDHIQAHGMYINVPLDALTNGARRARTLYMLAHLRGDPVQFRMQADLMAAHWLASRNNQVTLH